MTETAISTSRAESFTQFLTVFLVFLLVLALSYFTTRFVANFQKSASYNTNFEAIETYKITNGKYLQLVRVGEKYLVIGISKDNINLICEISADEVDLTRSMPHSNGFSKVLANNPFTKKKDNKNTFESIIEQAKNHLDKGGGDNEK